MADNQNQNKEFENMINEICKNIFPNMNLNEEQMKLFTEKFIKLSRDIHFLNDDRSKIKLEINHFLLDMPYVEMVYLQLEIYKQRQTMIFFCF